ncbi:MAG: hypothetical protein JXB07_21685 [Anaerolineae bacterium]|nr:hypothetical protein [Anaerolineae bacterium]
MRYRLGIEDIKPDYWIAWVFELPGCYSTGKTRAEAISQAGASIAGYQRWLSRHWPERAFEDPYIDVHVVEVFKSVQTGQGYIAHAFFEDDRIPLSSEEGEYVRRLLACSRSDLLDLVETVSPARRAETIDGEDFGSIDDILRHIGSEEWWYLDRLDVACTERDLPDEPLARLANVRAQLLACLPDLVGTEHTAWVDGEGWSARKLIRRVLWHERDHTQSIAKLLQAQTSEA